MKENNRKKGNDYERIAGEFLEKQGYEILEYNVYSRVGEIDIVAKEGGCLVFVEVKYRRDNLKGTPFESVSVMKQKRISRCALYYIKQHGFTDIQVRFDVVGITGEQIQVIRNAYDFAV